MSPAEPTAGGAASEVATSVSLAEVVASTERSPDNRARDRYRHPLETLTFFGIEPDMRVLEIRPGSGWYTEILAPYLAASGKLSVGIPSAEGPRAKYRKRFMDAQASQPEVFGAVETVTIDPPSPIDLGPDASVDLVLTFRNTHNWIVDGGAEQAYAAFFAVLRPGGVLGVVQHRADEGADPKKSAPEGYVPEAYVVQIAEAAGFTLEESSEINANDQDTRDYEEGVWTLPPVLRLEDQDRERYEAIAGAKTASLYRASCELGASYPAGREELAAELGRFGWEIGLGFQIVDDCLDVMGREDEVGKSVGNDVDDGKVTLPVLWTYARASEQVRSRIRDAYTLPGLEDRRAHLFGVCDLAPGVEVAMGRAEQLVEMALGRLQALEPSPARQALESLSDFVLQRKW